MDRRHPLRISIAELRRRPGSRRDIEVDAALDGLALTTSRVPDGATVHLTGVLESLSDGLTATGDVRAPYIGECRRCLAEVRDEVVAPFQEVFEPHAIEGETYPITGDEVDLEPMVRDAVLLALPLAPLCREDCEGPAPDVVPVHVAGEEREAVIDPRWAALDDVRFDN